MPFLAAREPRPFHRPCSTLPCFPRANLCMTYYSTVVCIGLKDRQGPTARSAFVGWYSQGLADAVCQASLPQLSKLSAAGVLYSSKPMIVVGLHHQCAVLLTVLLLYCLVANQHYPCCRILAVLKSDPALFYQQQSSHTTMMASTHLRKTPILQVYAFGRIPSLPRTARVHKTVQ